MGKHSGHKKKPTITSLGDPVVKEVKVRVNSPRAYDKDTEIFISMSKELKYEGNKLFQKRDYEGAILKYEKAIKLLPQNHIDVSYLRSNMAACFMEMGLSEYPRAIHECNLALEVTPKYSKALLKRARCYEALNRLDFSLRDVNTVLKMEPNNIMAIEIEERVRKMIENKGIQVNDVPIYLVPEIVEAPSSSSLVKDEKEKRKKKSKKSAEKEVKDESEEKKSGGEVEELKAKENVNQQKDNDIFRETKAEGKTMEKVEEKKAEDKLVVEEEVSTSDEGPKRNVKLVFGDDIRWAQLTFNCSVLKLREAICDRFPNLKALLVKYRDQEGDLVTITTNEELRWAEGSSKQGSIRIYVFEVSPEQDPLYETFNREAKDSSFSESKSCKGKQTVAVQPCIDDWVIQFAQLFKEYVGFNSDAYLDLHELGMKLYSEAMEDTVTSEEAQGIFNLAAEKFQEMAALALFNWGNVHMSRARKRVYFTEDASRRSILAQVKSAYDWAQNEYLNAGRRYEEALKIKPDLYECVLALGKQQFEQAKLSWYYAVGINVDLENWPSKDVFQLYNNAEDNMERGMQMWLEAEDLHLNEIIKPSKVKHLMQKMGLNGLYNKDLSAEEAAEQVANTRTQIYVLWGTLLYERSVMEFKLGLPVWQECLEVAIEKFELAGASPTDIAVMIKNHCSNDTSREGLGFNIDEITQAWHEMYEAKRWQSNVPSFRLEPLLRRRVSKLYHVLEHS